MLSSSRVQGNFRGLEASRPRPRTWKCVLEDSTSANSPPYTLIFHEAYVKHFALSDQLWLLVLSHVLKFLSINLLAVFLINKLIPPQKNKKKTIIIRISVIILIVNVLKVALNNFKGHITAKIASEGQKLRHFSYRALWSIAGQCRWAQSPWLRYWLQVWF